MTNTDFIIRALLTFSLAISGGAILIGLAK